MARDFKVYLPQVDTGIDCVDDVGDANYREVQIKYREKTPIVSSREFRPRDNFVCWFLKRNTYDELMGMKGFLIAERKRNVILSESLAEMIRIYYDHTKK